MKGFKLSKTSWLILSAGVFVVVLAGLGLTRSQQLKEQSRVEDELTLSETRLDKLQTDQLTQQLEDIRVKVEESEAQLKEAQSRLRQTVVSVDVTDEFFKVAARCNVVVTNLTTTVIGQSKIDAVSLSTISLSAQVTGKQSDLVNFIISLNNGYTTGKVQTAQISMAGVTAQDEEQSGESAEESGEDAVTETGLPTATVNMIIYSYEG